MPETTPLIKAALNLRVGAGFDVYLFTLYIRNFLHILLLEYMLQKASPQGENDTLWAHYYSCSNL